MFLFLYKKVYLCCRYNLKHFIQLVQIGDLPSLKECESFCPFSEDTVFKLLDVAVALGSNSIVEYLLEKYRDVYPECRKELNSYLQYSVEKNRLPICEILVKSGAEPRKGLRYSKSPNITKMLYRYINGFEMLN